MNDICLVFTPAYELIDDRLEAPLGLLYLATMLKESGFSVEIKDLSGVPKELWNLPEARWYGFSTYSTTYQRTLELRDLALKINPKAKTVAGGPHASALPHAVAKDFDHVLVGEGELAIIDLIHGGCDRIIIGTPVRDLDILPFPDYSLVDVNSYDRIVDGKKSFTILSSRGCPHKCLFCNSLIMGGHKPTRFRSPVNVALEIANLQNRYNDVTFRFGDDLFGGNRSWLSQFTDQTYMLDIVYRAFVRLNQCAKEWGFTNMLYESGCRHIAVGLESGSDIILGAMQKGLNTKTAAEGIRKAKDSGLIVRVYLIVGFPGETWDTVNETIEFVDKHRPDEFVVYPLIPYPGTPLFHAPEKYGLLNIDMDFTKYFQICGDKQSQFVYDLENADRVELQAMKDYMCGELEKVMVWAKDSEKNV